MSNLKTIFFFLLPVFQVRNRTSVRGKVANGVSPVLTSSPVTTASTRAASLSSANTANGASHALTTWHCIWNDIPEWPTAEVQCRVLILHVLHHQLPWPLLETITIFIWHRYRPKVSSHTSAHTSSHRHRLCSLPTFIINWPNHHFF